MQKNCPKVVDYSIISSDGGGVGGKWSLALEILESLVVNEHWFFECKLLFCMLSCWLSFVWFSKDEWTLVIKLWAKLFDIKLSSHGCGLFTDWDWVVIFSSQMDDSFGLEAKGFRLEADSFNCDLTGEPSWWKEFICWVKLNKPPSATEIITQITSVFEKANIKKSR